MTCELQKMMYSWITLRDSSYNISLHKLYYWLLFHTWGLPHGLCENSRSKVTNFFFNFSLVSIIFCNIGISTLSVDYYCKHTTIINYQDATIEDHQSLLMLPMHWWWQLQWWCNKRAWTNKMHLIKNVTTCVLSKYTAVSWLIWW